MLKPSKIKKKRNRNSQIMLFRYGAGVLTEPNKKHSKINGLWQPTNKMNNCFLLNFMDTLSKGEISCLYLE